MRSIDVDDLQQRLRRLEREHGVAMDDLVAYTRRANVAETRVQELERDLRNIADVHAAIAMCHSFADDDVAARIAHEIRTRDR